MFHRIKIFLLLLIMNLLTAGYAKGENFVIKPSIGLAERYDSNPYSKARGQDVKDDFLTAIAPQIEVVREGERFGLSGLYKLDSRFYSRNQQLNYVGHSASAGMNMEYSKNFSLDVNDSFLYSMESLDAIGTGIQTDRTDIISNTFSINLKNKYTQRASISLGLSDSILQFENPLLTDSRTDSVSVSVDYMLTAGRTASSSYGFTNYNFDGKGRNSGFQTHSLQLGFGENFSSALTMNLSGGVFYNSESVSDFNWMANASVLKTFQKSSVRLDYSRGVTNSAGLSDELNINDRLSTSWNLLLTKTLSASISGMASKNRSEPSATVNTISYSAGIDAGWQPYEWLRVAAGYTHFQQQTENVSGEDLSREQAFINITLGHKGWRF